MTEDDAFNIIRRPPYIEMSKILAPLSLTTPGLYVHTLRDNGWKLTEFSTAELDHHKASIGYRNLKNFWIAYILDCAKAGIEYE